MTTLHPAKFSDSLIPVMARMLDGCASVLDPMAGTGKLHRIRRHGFKGRIYLSELQMKWARQGVYTHTGVVVGNALCLPFRDGAVEAICTSPAFGCRLADHHNAQDGSRRHGYQFYYGEPLHLDNSGLLQWGSKYREFHRLAWIECSRVPSRVFIIDIKDHIRGGEVQPVSEWHRTTMESLGWVLREHVKVRVKGHRHGENWEKRLDHHNIFLFVR